jgi:FtsP/CotA-like multicopper oxidase with cupredoxin domain
MYGNRWLCCAFIVAAAAWGVYAQNGKANGKGKPSRDQVYKEKFKKIPPSEQKKAAQLARKRGLKPGIAGLRTKGMSAAAIMAAVADPGGEPHYFGPYGNWAYSPLPAGPINRVTVVDGGSGYSENPVVTIEDAYLPEKTDTVSGFTPAVVTAEVENGVIEGFTITDAGSGYMAPVVSITDATGTGALADATIGGTLTGGIRKFVDTLPGLGPAGANNLGQYIPVALPEPCTYTGQEADCYTIGLVLYEEKMHSDLPPTRLRGYVQLSTTAVPGAHIALPGVRMPDGTQAYAVDRPHYLGPVIVAQGKVAGLGAAGAARPVRITFYNLLPNSASGGNLLLPVDETVPGAGLGPALPGAAGDKYTQNRATIHLHGNNTVWISDGNTHQWITPASETTPYPAGVSARNVPDMGTGCDANSAAPGLPGDSSAKKSSGCMTFFYTNAQSARLQFYHDHAHGITRLNVYAGEAAGYVVTDAVEQDMINGTNATGVNPNGLKVLPGLGIPLVIQDKTFVDAKTIYAQDPTWAWGSGPIDPLTGAPAPVTGDFWYPHVYMPVTNPWDPTGTNAFGRWFYGPWFNPPTPTCVNGGPVGCIEHGPVPNPYAGQAPWEPPMNPGVPNPSIPGESFMDTPIVNGTAYPVLKVEPKAYRFRILNAANDRAQNLQLYVAADNKSPTTPETEGTLLCNGGVPVADCTEVKMIPVTAAPANQYADTPSGIPDPATKGPSWIQIGTEGGFTPAPVVIPHQPIGYNLDPAYFNFGIVNQHSLFLMAAERADVIVDFTQYAGRTLILYNDAPAPVPAGAAPYDNYTGNGNQMDSGGAPNTQPGYGPNTRTIMQIQVGTAVTTPTTDVTLANLQAVFAKTATKRGVFEISQDPIIIPQAAYNSAYNQSFPANTSQYILNVGDKQKSFQPLGFNGTTTAWNLQPAVTIPFEMKAMHDEMGGVYDTEFGRMSGMLGLSNPLSNVGFILPYPFSSPPTDVVKGSLESTKIGELADGTQIWRIFHNGVDTHPIHTHLFTAQVIARVGQDGQVAPGPFPTGQPVDAQNQGWKDTFYVNPLEITFLALRPTVPTPSEIPFELPNSKRLIDPMLPAGATLPPPGPAGWFDPNGTPIRQILNHVVNFGWEYVWHCHILSHEEMDFMHSLVFAAPPKPPKNVTGSWNGNANNPRITLNWIDDSTQEAGFAVQRALDANFMNGLTTVANLPASTGKGATVTYTDTNAARSSTYFYRVVAKGEVVGDVSMPAFPTKSVDSVSAPSTGISTFATAAAPAAPTNLTATAQAGPQVRLTWRDNSNNESAFKVERCSLGPNDPLPCTGFVPLATPGPNTAAYNDATVTGGSRYVYRVAAYNAAGDSAFVTLANAVTIPAIPAAPTGLTVVGAPANGNKATATLNWTAAANPASFTIQRANNLDFTTGLTTVTAAGNVRSLTQTVNSQTVYYYRIRANNNVGDSSAWTKALPFPILTP